MPLVSGTLMAKLVSGISGLIGGASFMIFYKPKNVWDAAIRSGLSVTAAIVFSPIVLQYMTIEENMNNIIASSVVLGFCSWSIISMIARTLIKIQDEKTTLRLPKIIDKE